jgi:hypothetical protein
MGKMIGMAGCNGYSHTKAPTLEREVWKYIFFIMTRLSL